MIWPHPLTEQRWTEARYGGEGNAQPWVQLLLYSLIRCVSAREVIEFGAFRGVTTAWLALAVEANGGGVVTGVEIAHADVDVTLAYLQRLMPALPNTLTHIAETSTLAFIGEHPDRVRSAQFIFIDDDKASIAEKVAALRATGCRALLAVHDVDGDYVNTPPLRDLWPTLGGLTVPAPKLHENGHLGLLQL